MNKSTIWFVLVITALLSSTAGYWLAREGDSGATDMVIAGSDSPEPLFYRNPMNPAITSPVPAKDEMGMDYIPVYADDNAGATTPGTVLIDPVTRQSMGVRTRNAEYRSLARIVQTLGRVGFDETRITRLHPKTEGWIEDLRVETTGQQINSDEILLSFYSPQLVAAQEEYLLAVNGNASTTTSRQLAATALRRLELLDVPAHQIEELKRDRQVKKYLHIHSPNAGTIINVGAREGQFVTPATELYFIADLSRVWVFVDIFENELAWVQAGDEAVMTVRGLPGRTFKGQLAYIYPYADRMTRTVKARLEFDNPDLLLKPEMYVDIRIAAQPKSRVTAVPTESIIRSGTREKVFVETGDGTFEPREVVLGVSTDGWTEILEGVDPGESVVTSAQFLIDSESRLREAVAKMSSGSSMKHAMHEDHSMHQDPSMHKDIHQEMDHSKHEGHKGHEGHDEHHGHEAMNDD